MTFLGHVVSDKGVEVDPWTTEAVKSWTKPLTPTDIRSLFCLASYYHMFVEGFSSIASSLTTLTKKKAKFEWTKACEKSFLEIKDRLTSTRCLPCLRVVRITLCIVMHLGLVWIVFLCRVVR